MRILEDYPLSELVYYRIGKKADIVFEVSSIDEIREALKICREKSITRILFLGLGSNIILPDTDYKGAVIFLQGNGTSIEITGNRVKAFAGETMDTVIRESLSESLIGLEWAGGLPSSVGGAVRGNAGAFGSETKDTFVEAEVIDTTDEELSVRIFTQAEAQFSYRDSYFKQHPNLLIISATFQLSQGSIEQVAEAEAIYQKNIEYRQTHHPMEYPSCGSVFKNITRKDEVEKILAVWPEIRELSEKKWHNKISMGYVINKLGFAERRIGGAMISPKHTNYISNIDHAKGSDVRALINEIQGKFESTFGFSPEPEVIIIEASS